MIDSEAWSPRIYLLVRVVYFRNVILFSFGSLSGVIFTFRDCRNTDMLIIGSLSDDISSFLDCRNPMLNNFRMSLVTTLEASCIRKGCDRSGKVYVNE